MLLWWPTRIVSYKVDLVFTARSPRPTTEQEVTAWDIRALRSDSLHREISRLRYSKQTNGSVPVKTTIKIALIAFAATSIACEVWAQALPGAMIDIGGHSVHLVCSGEGERTILLDAEATQPPSRSLAQGPVEGEIRAQLCQSRRTRAR